MPIEGVDGLRQFIDLYRTSFPDLKVTIDEQNAQSAVAGGELLQIRERPRRDRLTRQRLGVAADRKAFRMQQCQSLHVQLCLGINWCWTLA